MLNNQFFLKKVKTKQQKRKSFAEECNNLNSLLTHYYWIEKLFAENMIYMPVLTDDFYV